MKKIYSTILMVLCSVNLLVGTEFTFTAAADMNQTKDGVTVVLAQGNGQSEPVVKTDYETQSPEMRLYLNNTITVSSSETLKNIQLVCAKSSATNKEYADLSANAGKLDSGGVSAHKNDWKVDTWTGEAKEVVFTLTGKGQRRIKQLVVNGDLVEIVDPEQPLPTENDLDWSYEYVEPEYIHVPDTQIFHKQLNHIPDFYTPEEAQALYAHYRERYLAQLPGSTYRPTSDAPARRTKPDPQAPLDPVTRTPKRYAQFPNFIRAMLYLGLKFTVHN